MFEIYATKNDATRTLYKVIQKYLSEVPLSKIEQLFRKKDIKVNGRRIATKNYKVIENDHIIIYGIVNISLKENKKFEYKNELSIIYEDENILVVNKKTGIAVHGYENCLDNLVLGYLNYQKIDSFIPSHVGRLDKDTSGIMIYGKNYLTIKSLNQAQKYFIKKYQFLSDFIPNNNKINLYFYQDSKLKKNKVSSKPVANSKIGTTLFYMENKKKIAQILNGRKHQIRLTLKYLNKPIYGDKKYGGKIAPRLMLHSYYLKLNNLPNELNYLNNMEFWCPIKW
ncbi:pseudouridine synthase [Mycoplasmopsis cricetuli]|uniref:pseudouridine synthase n=1 Tax=Mycoplasmopsis cricetuli TaxID=171283 RepID=UPI000471EC12|nr:RluA family pseudouridine synthase [Mycoplasmopsis cricetuli]